MTGKSDPIWWIELIKVSPGLITAALAVAIIVAYRKEVRTLLARMTRFKGLGIEAEFDAKKLDDAIVAQKVTADVSDDDRKGALKRLHSIGPLLRDKRILWVDDDPPSTRNERALLEGYGARVTIVTTSAAAEQELRNHVYLMVITDLQREGRDTEGLHFVDEMVQKRLYRWTIAYVGTDQRNKARPANLFAITNRPDHLIQYICDIVARESL